MTQLTIGDFVQRVRDLARRPVRTAEELARWQDAAAQLRTMVTPLIADRFPHVVWHYLADVDIRFRDDQYRKDKSTSSKRPSRESPAGNGLPTDNGQREAGSLFGLQLPLLVLPKRALSAMSSTQVSLMCSSTGPNEQPEPVRVRRRD